MKSFQRLNFRGHYLEIDAISNAGPYVDTELIISFNCTEDFHELVARLANLQPDEQVKLAYAALENEMGYRNR